MSAKANRYLKRPEDFSYRVALLDTEDLKPLGVFLEDMKAEDTLYKEVCALQGAEDDLGGTFLLAKDGFTNQLVGFMTCTVVDDHGTARIETVLIHPDHGKRGLARIMLAELERIQREKSGTFGAFICAFDGKTRWLSKERWSHTADLLVFEKFKWRSRFSKRTVADEKDVVVASATKALNDGWSIFWEEDQLAMTKECVARDLANANRKYIVLRLASSEADYILFRIVKDTIILYDHHFSSDNGRNTLMAYLDREVVAKGFRKVVAYAPSDTEQEKNLRQMGFWRNPFTFGGSNAKFPIYAKNLHVEEQPRAFTPFHFNYHPLGDFLAAY